MSGRAVAAVILAALCACLLAACDLLSGGGGGGSPGGGSTTTVTDLVLTIGFQGEGSTSPDSFANVKKDQPVTVTATPASGQVFVEWKAAYGKGIAIASPYSASTQITLSSGNAAVLAVFQPAEERGQVTVSCSGGGTTIPEGGFTIPIGQPYELALRPEGTNLLYSYTPSSGLSVTKLGDYKLQLTLDSSPATLDLVYTDQGLGTSGALTLQNSEGGLATSSASDPAKIQHNKQFNLSGIPNTGYIFDRWEVVTGGGLAIDALRAINTAAVLKSGDATVKAWFKLYKEFNLAMTAGTGGMIDSVAAEQPFAQGSFEKIPIDVPISLTAVPDANYFFLNWTASPASVILSNANALTTDITLTEADGSLTANFEPVCVTASTTTTPWSSPQDNDGDGYVSAATLTYKLANSSAAAKSVYEVLGWRASGSTTWNKLWSSSVHSVAASGYTGTVRVTAPTKLVKGTYYFRLSVYRSGHPYHAEYVKAIGASGKIESPTDDPVGGGGKI